MALLNPRYKRLVDQIYLKPNQKDGPVTLDSNNIITLSYFSSNYPEKVAKVANYLHKKIKNQVKKRKLEYVDVSLQAMDILLTSPTAHAYNLYAEHFLVVAATMLDTDDYDVQLLATRSMVKFAGIREETPFYHGRYEPLIVKYSDLCKDRENRKKILGAKGLHAIVTKISLEDLAENIWEPVSLDQIISGLLQCMTQFQVSRETISLDTCGQEGEKCFSLLMSTASFSQVVSVLNSVYNYIDESNLWGETHFVDHVYHLIMHSIQNRYWPTIVMEGIFRLRRQVNAPVSTKRNQLNVFCTMLELMKNQELGILPVEYLNYLLNEISHLSLDNAAADSQEVLYAQDLMDCLEWVSTCLAEYDRQEMMVIIVNKILDTKPGAPVRSVMFECLYSVSQHYHNRFPIAMYKPLLQLMQEPATAIRGQDVFQTLLDIHGNLVTINKPGYDLKVKSMPFCWPNARFIQEHDLEIYRVLVQTLKCDNLTLVHIATVYKTLAVMGGFQDPNVVVRFLSCLLVIQDMAVAGGLSSENSVALLIATLALLKAVSNTTAMRGLEHYSQELVSHRQHTRWQTNDVGNTVSNCCLIDEKIICNRILGQSEDDAIRSGLLNEITALKTLLLSKAPLTDREPTNIDVKSRSTSRLFKDPSANKQTIAEDLSFEAMKAVLAEPMEETRKKIASKQNALQKKFESCTFQDIVNDLHNEDEANLRQQFRNIINSETILPTEQKPLNEVLEERFPDVFY